ncbi:O-antigen ligase family protein [Stenomitos frigidus]|uniref:Polymerase n=2 Tax=Stenomitos TaxID=1844270 RepID=A0A2T1EGM3_9CYAN|nr:O-antigen ligase family protein [Stenomitos frigidus]PSB31848.1 polymerase [Stenomitos frigidus ULC18]
MPSQPHPNAQLQTHWNVAQLSVLLLPFSSLLGSAGLLLVAIGVWQKRFQHVVRRPLNWGLAVLSLLLLLSTALAFKQIDALLGLFNFLPFFFVFAGLSELIQTPAQLRRLAWLLVISSVPVVAIGLGQQFFGLAGHVQILWILVDWSIDPTGTPPGRMASIFFYANVLASYLAITLTLSLGLWIEAFFGGQRSVVSGQWSAVSGQLQLKTQNSKVKTSPPSTPHSLLTRLFITIAMFGNAIALILTNSRNAWAIAVFACLAYALYLGWRWLLLGVGVVVSSALGAAFAPPPGRDWLRAIVPAFFWARLTDQLYTDRPVAQLRSTQWHFAWSLAQQRPLTGWGLRNFSPLYQAQMQYFIGHPHNLLLMLSAETGFPSALLFFGLVGWVVVQGSLLLYDQMPLSISTTSHHDGNDRLVYFSYLVAFTGCALFSFLDITLFDVRINLLGWLLLAAIAGVVYQGKGKG